MKTFFIWIIAGLSVCSTIAAQGYGGRYGGRGGYGGGYGGGGYGGGRRNGGNPEGMRYQSQTNKVDYSQVCITDFPEITGLTLKQNLDLSTVVTDEHKNILKLTDQKQELQAKIDSADNQKAIDKNTKKMAKIDEKIQKVSLKADTKIRAILTNDQYNEFKEKKNRIKFGFLPTGRGGFRPNPNQQGNGNLERRERSAGSIINE